jgi:hypothetical protein
MLVERWMDSVKTKKNDAYFTMKLKHIEYQKLFTMAPAGLWPFHPLPAWETTLTQCCVLFHSGEQ